MHVASIDMTVSGRKTIKATAAVAVVDAGGAPVPDAMVHGEWSDAVTGSSNGLTDGSGEAVLTSPGLKNASGRTFVFTVTDIVKGGWSYDTGANVETGDAVTVP